ncbi:MAG: rhodanese-like domain-containing protein [bacterium]|nr:rhodanese-like domain-containing protein [bacterium]
MNVSKQSNLVFNYPGFLLRFLLSAIFIISAIGKLLDSHFTTQIIAQLFQMSLFISQIMVVLLIVLELIIAVIVWKKQIPKIFITVPFLLLVATLFSYWNDLNCGCFGSLPFLSQMSLGAHVLLLSGMFLGILFLINCTKPEQESEKRSESQQFYQKHKLVRLTGYIAVALMLAAFFTLPFSAQDNNVHNYPTDHLIVDRDFVEAAMGKDQFAIIDARPEFQYVMGHIPNSLNIPYNTTYLDSLLQRFALTEKLLIVYCSDSRCNTADILTKRLQDSGYTKIAIYAGGWKDWSR